MNLEDDAVFYGACAQALGIAHEYHKPMRRRTRWNNRRLGNGRFPGFGLVRLHGAAVIIISHRGTKPFGDRATALAWLRDLSKPADPET